MELPILNFNEKFEIKTRKSKDKFFIYDTIRKSWFLLTPEEWVRQHWVHFLLKNKNYQHSSLILEQKLTLNGLSKRLDLLVTEKTIPKILIECKAPHIQLTQTTFEQIARYNSVLKAPQIILSNGIYHIFAHFHQNKYIFVPTMEEFFNF